MKTMKEGKREKIREGGRERRRERKGRGKEGKTM